MLLSFNTLFCYILTLLVSKYKEYEVPATATLSSKYQISIPKSVLEEQHWQAGQQFLFIPKGKGMLLMPIPSFEDLKGIAAGADPTNFRDRSDRF
jgi:bifunctional DNA-binding transcriptional regulator/antitoxin component of YhaV-PrlF toxin-antitoxin module